MIRISVICGLVLNFFSLTSMDTTRKKLIPIHKIDFPIFMYTQFISSELMRDFATINHESSTKKISEAIHQLAKKRSSVHNAASEKISASEIMKSYGLLDALSYIDNVYLAPKTHFLAPSNYLEQILSIHQKLARFTSTKAGKLRTGKVWHRIKELTPTEELFHAALENHSKSHEKNNFLRGLKCPLIQAQDIKDLLVAYEFYPELRPIELQSPKTIAIDEVDTWVTQQEGQIVNITTWLKSRYQAQAIEDELKIIPTIVHKDMHPIKQAALVWFHMMRINPFEENNDLIAYLLACTILVKHNCLPPQLESMHQLQSVFANCLDSNNPKPFIRYVYEQIIVQNKRKTKL